MTRRLAWHALVIASELLLNRCGPVTSFFPLYKSDDKVFEWALWGFENWQNQTAIIRTKKKERWRFVKSRDEFSHNLKLGAVGVSGVC